MEDLARPLTVAPVSGWSAFVCARLLASRLDQLTGGTHPELAAELRGTLAALEQAAGAWTRWRQAVAEIEAQAAADGSAAVAGAAAQAGSAEVDTTAAAARLRVTPNRVRQLIRCEQLPGRKVGRAWLVEASTLDIYAEGRGRDGPV